MAKRSDDRGDMHRGRAPSYEIRRQIDYEHGAMPMIAP